MPDGAFGYPPVDDALTRSQLLTLRGEPPASNGVAVPVEASPPATTNGARPCSECHEPLPAEARPERLTCSSTCAKARELRVRREGRRAVAPVVANAEHAWNFPAAAAPPDLLAQLMALAASLPVGWSVQLDANGVAVTWAPGA